MLRTNTKKAIQNIRAWIIDNTIDSIADERHYYNTNPAEAADNAQRAAHCNAIWDLFEDETDNDKLFALIAQFIMNDFDRVQRHGVMWYPSQVEFTEYAERLPLVTFDYYTYYSPNPIQALGDILEETEEERNKYSEEKAAATLTALIYREVTKVTIYKR